MPYIPASPSAPFPPGGPPEVSSCPSAFHARASLGAVSPPPPSAPASVDGHVSDTAPGSNVSPARTGVSRQASATTSAASHASTSSTASALPSMRWVQTLNKLTMAKASQVKSLAEARREHCKTHESPDARIGCSTCSDYGTRGAALLAELEEMDKTLREMEDVVVEDVRAFKAARRREKRERERERKRDKEREVRKSAAGAA